MRKSVDILRKETLGVGAGIVFLTLLAGAIQFPLSALFIFFTLSAYVVILRTRDQIKRADLLPLGFLYLVGVAAIVFLRDYSSLSGYFFPAAAFAMLTVLLYRRLELGFIFTLGLAVTAGLLYGADLYLTADLAIGGCLAGLLVWQARRRSNILAAGFFVGIAQSCCALTFYKALGPMVSVKFCVIPFLNGLISAFLVAGLLPFLEYCFKIVTDISLLELADFNHPLLKRLVFEAPGTYHHSLMVGNISEVAAEAVGANPLLARVGAYYHDIGKLSKPEYFSENQDCTLSKHDRLSASMSKLVIMEHVKNGVDLARKNRLNDTIVDFIQQHHGTSLVYYFYRRALEQTEDEEAVKEEVFRYPGPKPQTKEAAIVLLADSVEAACRSLEEPNAARIADLVHRIINNKFIDGQLDMCDLTLKDLEKISTTFIHILAGFYHSRVDYPKETEQGEKH